jgi:glycosyltransferase involved in cell wall biosynthesis
MRELRAALRDLLPGPLRERYHRHALRRDFGIDRRRGSRRPTSIDPRQQPGLNIIGYFDSPSGVGQSARALAGAAECRGVSVSRIEAAVPSANRRAEDLYDVNLYHVNADGAAGVVEELGPELHAGRANVAYWYWESETFPQRWRDRFDYFDEIWVASDFCRQSIAAVSPIPVRLVPPPVAVAQSPTDAKARAGVQSSDFLFLTILDALSVPERKNPVGTVRAFVRAFAGSPEALLLVLVSNANGVPGLLSTLREASRGARVQIRDAVLSRPEIETFLAACDAYASLHRAEGFGLPIAEAMAIGKPVIATNYSGNTDYLDESTGFPVRWESMTLSQRVRDYDSGTRWAEPDEGHAIELFQRVLTDRAEARRRGEAARRRIAERYDPRLVGGQIGSRLAQLRERLKKTA